MSLTTDSLPAPSPQKPRKTRRLRGYRPLVVWNKDKRFPRARVNLIRARESCGLSAPMVGGRLNLSRQFIHNVEIGKRNPNLKIATRWVRVLRMAGADATLDLFIQPDF